MISVGGISALLGSLVARPLAKAVGYGPAIVLAFCISVVGLLMLIPAAAFKEWSILFLVLQQFLGDCGIMIFTILAVSLQQKLLPEDQLARANGFNQVVNGARHDGVDPDRRVGRGDDRRRQHGDAGRGHRRARHPAAADASPAGHQARSRRAAMRLAAAESISPSRWPGLLSQACVRRAAVTSPWQFL